MTTCKWDRDAEEYLVDGERCRVDEYGDPTVHCTARRTCSQHVGWGELTCARCLGRTRRVIRRIVELSALMLPEAIVTGVEAQAASLAGPAADPEAWSWRKIAARQGRAWHLSETEEDDDRHPFTVLTRWAWMLSAPPPLGYGTVEPEVWNITNAADFLDRILSRVAQDENQDYPGLNRELLKCCSHLETVWHDSLTPDRGAPCPECKGRGKFVRLVRWYPHWCDDEDCEQIHYDTDEGDRWVCPADEAHSWDLESYSRWVEDRKAVGA